MAKTVLQESLLINKAQPTPNVTSSSHIIKSSHQVTSSPCGTAVQDPEHILQHCPTHAPQGIRLWPSVADLKYKLRINRALRKPQPSSSRTLTILPESWRRNIWTQRKKISSHQITGKGPTNCSRYNPIAVEEDWDKMKLTERRR